MKSVIFALVFITVLRLSDAIDMQDARFFRQTICDVETRIALGCFNQTSSNNRGLIDCLTACNEDNACIGASVTNNDSWCYIHTSCPGVLMCTEASTDHDYYSKNCDNKGSWNPESISCTCSVGWVGKHCDRRPKSCGELVAPGHTMEYTRAVLDLTDKHLPQIEVICLIESAISSVVFMKNDGHVDNSEVWINYREGFESSAYNLWLGLDKWHILSKAGYNTMVLKAEFTDGCKFEWCYEDFHLSGESSNYTFTFSSVVNETSEHCGGYKMGDCFSPLQNVPFSTDDMDNDPEAGLNCAAEHGSGWWYDACEGPCRLLGWRQSHSTTKAGAMLIKLIGIGSNEMLGRLDGIEMTLRVGTCHSTAG